MTRRRTLLVAALVAVALLVASPVLRGQVVKAARQLYGSTLYVVGGGYIGGPVGIGTPAVAGQPLTTLFGAGTGTGVPSGVIYATATAVGNAANTTGQNLISYAVPANTLNANGRGIRITAWGTFAANANVKTVTMTWAGDATTVASYGGTPNGESFVITAVILRSAAAVQASYGAVLHGSSWGVTKSVAYTGDTTTALTINLTAQAAAGVADDIIYKGCIIEVF